MSRILKHKKKFFIYLLGLVVCMILLEILIRSIPITLCGCALYLMAAVLNELICRKIKYQKRRRSVIIISIINIIVLHITM